MSTRLVPDWIPGKYRATRPGGGTAWPHIFPSSTRLHPHRMTTVSSSRGWNMTNRIRWRRVVNVNREADHPVIGLLHAAGCSSSDCLLFNSLNVRARTEDFARFYTDDLWKPHRDFAQKLWANMWAKVEIWMGKDAFEDLSKSAILKHFPLWGKFEKVRLWVEVDNDQTSVKRFIIHAYQPAFFPKFRHTGTSNGPRKGKGAV